MDKIILGQDCFIDDEIGTFRPNNNQMIVGCSGTGKSMSVLLPTILNMRESSMIATYSKAGEARKIAEYQRSKGYTVDICDLTNPEMSTVSFDPLDYVRSNLDVENLAKSIVFADPRSKNERDVYWTDSAAALLSAFIYATIRTNEKPSMNAVLELFGRFEIKQEHDAIRTSLDAFFNNIREKVGACEEVRAFRDYRQLPYQTAGCVRDFLAKALNRLYPEPVRKLMENNNGIDFRKISKEKRSLIIITSAVNVSLYMFANQIFGTAIKELLEYADKCPGQRLPRPIRLLFDDFACAAKINDFSKHIAIFRAAGLSAMMLLQSEDQLRSLYSAEEATNILNNCSSYVYFPGGMDLTTCKNVSQRLDLPLAEVMYAPTAQVMVMQSGKQPVTIPRYDIFNSNEYKEYEKITKRQCRLTSTAP